MEAYNIGKYYSFLSCQDLPSCEGRHGPIIQVIGEIKTNFSSEIHSLFFFHSGGDPKEEKKYAFQLSDKIMVIMSNIFLKQQIQAKILLHLNSTSKASFVLLNEEKVFFFRSLKAI